MLENPKQKKAKKKKPAKSSPTKRIGSNAAFNESFDVLFQIIKERYIDNIEENEVLVESAVRLSLGLVKDLPTRRPILDAYHYNSYLFMSYISEYLKPDIKKDVVILTQYGHFYVQIANLYNRIVDDNYILAYISEIFESTLGTLSQPQQEKLRSLYAGYVKEVAYKFRDIDLEELLREGFASSQGNKYYMGVLLVSLFVGITRSPSYPLASSDSLVSVHYDAFEKLYPEAKYDEDSMIESGIVKVAYKNRFGRWVTVGDIRVIPSIKETAVALEDEEIDEEREAEINRKLEEERVAREEEAREKARIAEEEAKAAEEAALAAAREADEARLEAERLRALEEAEKKATIAAARIEQAKEEALQLIAEKTIRSYRGNKPSWADFREFINAGTLTKDAIKAKIKETWALRPVSEQRSRAEVSNLVSNVTQPVPTAIEAKAATSTELPLAALQDAIDEQAEAQSDISVEETAVSFESSDSQVGLRVRWAAEKAMEPWGYSFTALYGSSGLADMMNYDSFEAKVREELRKQGALDLTLARQEEVVNLSVEEYRIRNCRAWVVLYVLNEIREFRKSTYATSHPLVKEYGYMSYVDLMPAMTYDEEKLSNEEGKISPDLVARLDTLYPNWKAAIRTLSRFESGEKTDYRAELLESHNQTRKEVISYLQRNILEMYTGTANQLFIMPENVTALKSYYMTELVADTPHYFTDPSFTFDSYRSAFGIYSAVGEREFDSMLRGLDDARLLELLFTKALEYCGPKARTIPYSKSKKYSQARKALPPIVSDKGVLGAEIWMYIRRNRADWRNYIHAPLIDSLIEEDERLFDYGMLRGPFGMQVASAKVLTAPEQAIIRDYLPELGQKYGEIKSTNVRKSRRKIGKATEERAKIVSVLLDYYSPEEIVDRNPSFMFNGKEEPILYSERGVDITFDWFYRWLSGNLGREGTRKASYKKAKRDTSLYLMDERLGALRDTLEIYAAEVAKSIAAYRDFTSANTIQMAVNVSPQYYDLASTMQAVFSVRWGVTYRRALPDWVDELESTLNTIPTLGEENLNARIAMVVKAYAVNLAKYPEANSHARVQAMQDTAVAMRLSIEFVRIVTTGVHSSIEETALNVRTPAPVIYRGRNNPSLDNDIIFSLYFNDGISADNLAAIYDVEEEDIYDILAS